MMVIHDMKNLAVMQSQLFSWSEFILLQWPEVQLEKSK